jgi:hypothetical protein
LANRDAGNNKLVSSRSSVIDPYLFVDAIAVDYLKKFIIDILIHKELFLYLRTLQYAKKNFQGLGFKGIFNLAIMLPKKSSIVCSTKPLALSVKF